MMVRRISSIFPLLIALVLWAVPASAGAGASAATEWRGMDAAIREPMELVVEDRAMWQRLWLRAFGKDAPQVDFDRCFVACVFLGDRADWYYSISFENPVAKGDEYVVGYGLVMLRVELAPKSSGVIDVGVPGQYAMKALPKREGLKPVLRMMFKEGEYPKERGKLSK